MEGLTTADLESKQNVNLCHCGAEMPDVDRFGIALPSCEGCTCEEHQRYAKFPHVMPDLSRANCDLQILSDDEDFWRWRRFDHDKVQAARDAGFGSYGEAVEDDPNVVRSFVHTTRVGVSVDVLDQAAFRAKWGDAPWLPHIYVFQVKKTVWNVHNVLEEFDGDDGGNVVGAYSPDPGLTLKDPDPLISLVVETADRRLFKYSASKHHATLEELGESLGHVSLTSKGVV